MTQLEDTERRGLRRFLQILASTWAVVAFGTIGYTVIEGWSFNESFYMTVITLTTVGFGEVHPLGPIGQVFTSILIMLGVGLLAYSASVLGAFFLDGTFTGYVRRRRLHKAIEGLKDHCIVCGFGRTGSRVIDNLKARKIPFVVIEKDEQVAEELLATGVAVIHGSAHHNDVLQEAGIAHARALISCASDDAENVYITLSARSLRQDLLIVARAEGEDAEEKLTRAGADLAVNPYAFAGERLVASVYRPHLVEFLDDHVRGLGDYDVHEFRIPTESPFANKKLGESSLRAQYGINVLMVRRQDGEVVANPGPEDELRDGDMLVYFGQKQQLDAFESECAKSK